MADFGLERDFVVSGERLAMVDPIPHHFWRNAARERFAYAVGVEVDAHTALRSDRSHWFTRRLVRPVGTYRSRYAALP